MGSLTGNDRGSATLLSIFLASIIITVGVGFNWYVREHLKAAEGFRLKTDAMAGAYSAFDKVVYALAADLPSGRVWRLQDVQTLGVQEVLLTGDPVGLPGNTEVSIRDGSSFVTLQPENADVLRRLVANAAGKDPAEFIDSYLDWIDTDSLVRLNGAEQGYYRTIGATVMPRNGPIQYKEELLFIRGMDKETYKKIEPYISVLPPGGFNPNTSPVPVARAFLNMDEGKAKELVQFAGKNILRSANDVGTATGTFVPGMADMEFTAAPYLEVTVKGGNKPGYYRIHAGVDISKNQEGPYSIIFWRED